MVVGCKPTKEEAPIFEIHRTATTYIPDCEEAITARLTAQGLDVGLSKQVPIVRYENHGTVVREALPPFISHRTVSLQLVAASVDPFVRDLVGPDIDYEKDLVWAVHPGGKAIVDATEKGCKLSKGRLNVSR